MPEQSDVAGLSDTDCPRCGCWMKTPFICGCGKVNAWHCVNCGRFTSLARVELIELTEMQARCEKGRVVHEHPPEEASARWKAYAEKLRLAKGPELNPDDSVNTSVEAF